ncbi:hypothetical protein NP493_1572g00020 [Ridgeia piscesae]|uniref:Uncharacterized protein n=1 Tax=Ridgeia piscesae TaxID=27915 RepID=A0AAD9NBY7_RIDPI|nr:hypothetical protein NP493_1572g00020 [Ridgeia piscesae]
MDGTRSGNTSLTYTAPTEPKKKKQVEPTDGQEVVNTAVLHAVAVTAYKLVDGNFTSQGKLGAAIIGNHSESSYKLLLYVSKQQQITHANINVNFHFAIQPSNYANFYDSARQNWSMLFESAKQLVEFARQVSGTSVTCV